MGTQVRINGGKLLRWSKRQATLTTTADVFKRFLVENKAVHRYHDHRH